MSDYRKKKSRVISEENGGTSIFALSVVMACFLMASAYLYMAQADLRIATRQVQAKQALYLAEAGVELARNELTANPAWVPLSRYNLSTGSFTLVITTSGTVYTVESSGKAGEANKKIRVILQPNSQGKLIISSYSEMFN